ncbi:MAG: hypothetical protein ACRD0V_02325, partial [Acidimicrobiales bacterium]
MSGSLAFWHRLVDHGRGAASPRRVGPTAAAAARGEDRLGSILGNRVARLEDPRFLTVGGTYVED